MRDPDVSESSRERSELLQRPIRQKEEELAFQVQGTDSTSLVSRERREEGETQAESRRLWT